MNGLDLSRAGSPMIWGARATSASNNQLHSHLLMISVHLYDSSEQEVRSEQDGLQMVKQSTVWEDPVQSRGKKKTGEQAPNPVTGRESVQFSERLGIDHSSMSTPSPMEILDFLLATAESESFLRLGQAPASAWTAVKTIPGNCVSS